MRLLRAEGGWGEVRGVWGCVLIGGAAGNSLFVNTRRIGYTSSSRCLLSLCLRAC